MLDEEGNSLFAFQDLDYLPIGFDTLTAPYIETPISTMRAAATLMRLDLHLHPETSPKQEKAVEEEGKQEAVVVCDLGCGDGEFLLSLLHHINTPTVTPPPHVPRIPATGVGVDYNASLIATAGIQSAKQNVDSKWLIYDFNADVDDIVGQLLTVHKVTHVMVCLVPKQLALPTVKKILMRLCKEGVVVCCYKFHPLYLRPVRRDVVMNLVVYDATSCEEMEVS